MVVDGAYQQSIFHVCLQEETLKAKFEATSKAKALTEVLIDFFLFFYFCYPFLDVFIFFMSWLRT